MVIVTRGKYEGEYGEVVTVVKSEGEETVLIELFDGGYQTFDIDHVEMCEW